MSASAFDPKTFAQMSFTGANSTESVPVPVGEFAGTIDSYKVDTWRAKDGSSEGLKVYILWAVADPAVAEVTGREKNIVRQEMMLDLVENTGALDMGKGKNVRLGRVREAIGLNDPSQPWNFDMFVGRQAKIVVAHRADQRDPSLLYAEVKDTAKL